AAHGPRPVMKARMRGDYWITSGEVLIDSYAVEGAGASRSFTAEVEWTFPLDFVEDVWRDGVKVYSQIARAADLAPFVRHKFAIPFNAAGKKWVRFAAWDSAGNGATIQPIKLATAGASTAGR